MTIPEIIDVLLANRGLTDAAARDEFFHPAAPDTLVSPVDSTPLSELLKTHRADEIAIFGDYDVDGVCSTAIMWETLRAAGLSVRPFIPHRRDHGYGLSQKGADELLQQGVKLIVAIDCGIVAHEVVEYIRAQGCDVAVIDHHEALETYPRANVVLHDTSTCAAALAWYVARDLRRLWELPPAPDDHLGLAALGIVCDLIPLLGPNRSLVKAGLAALTRTRRPGLTALYHQVGLAPDVQITTYHCGFVIGPRLNAMGRLEHALDSLRLLCTTDPARAASLAQLLDDTNKARQELTETALQLALQSISPTNPPALLVAASPEFDEGVIGLVAAKLVEKFHRPALAISIQSDKAKGSARSIAGFDITTHLRSVSHLLTGVGGHTMAAGFSLDPARLPEFTAAVSTLTLPEDLLRKVHRYDLEIDSQDASAELLQNLALFEPFGLGNPTPVFKSTGSITGFRRMGSANQHLKFRLNNVDSVYFHPPAEVISQVESASSASVWYQLGQNTWNGQTTLQFLVKHLV